LSAQVADEFMAKSKKSARNMIDTHAHMLPGVDHGSPDLETTMRMLREAAAQGVETVVCTPHLYELDARLVERAHEVHEEVKIELQKAAIPIRLLLGFEVDAAVAVTADDDTLRGLTIEGSERSLLVEMPYNGWPLYLEQTVFRLSAAGFLPILAHPERNERVQHSPDVLTACLNAGAIVQGTAGSLSSMFRRQSLKTFHELLGRGWFSLLASDAHSQPEYTWTVVPLLADLGKRVSPEGRELLTRVNPARVLAGQRPLPVPVERPSRSRRFKLR
jgi:protein-tyrosine phosphatase